MIIKEDFLKKLRNAFDLNIYEGKIWTALLSKGLASAGELSEISNVPRSRSYDVLESLEKKGFIVMKLGKPIKYLAVDPREVMHRVKKGLKFETDEKIDGLEKVKTGETFKELELLYKHGIEHVDPTSLSGVIKGRRNIYNHLDSILRNAKKSIIISTSNSEFIDKVNHFGDLFKKLNSKNIDIKIVVNVDEDVKKVLKQLNGDLKVRNIPKNLSSRFILVDGKDIVFMISDDKDVHEDYDIAIWASTPFFASAMENLFNSNWEKLSKVN